jgi:hypothetical protein
MGIEILIRKHQDVIFHKGSIDSFADLFTHRLRQVYIRNRRPPTYDKRRVDSGSVEALAVDLSVCGIAIIFPASAKNREGAGVSMHKGCACDRANLAVTEKTT